MLPRSASFTALAAAVLVLPASDSAPTTTKYRIDQSLSQEIDATAAGGAKQSISFTTISFITVTLADSAGGKAMRVVVDSVRGDSATPIPAAVLDSARGAEFHGFVEKSGKPLGLEPVTGTSAAVQIQGLLSDFFPWIRAGLKVGDSWADTTAKVNGEGSRQRDRAASQRLQGRGERDPGTPGRRCGSPRTSPPRWRAPSRLRTARRESREAAAAKAPTMWAATAAIWVATGSSSPR